MLYLVASCIALLLGPLFYRYFSSGSGLQKGLDGFIFVSLGGLVLIHILPELLEHGGILAIIFVILGLWGPSASEKLFHRYSEITHNLTLTLGIGGLLLHTITDGGAMVLAQQEGNSSLLALGVIMHRLPVGLAIWWLLKPQVGTRWASLVLLAMMALTSVGYFAGEQLLSHLSLDNTVYLQAFVTGSILHVVLHQPHGHGQQTPSSKYEYHAGIGSLLGIGLLALLLMMDSGGHQHAHHDHSTDQLLHWLLLLAPVLLAAYALASIRFAAGLSPTQASLPGRWLQRLAGPEALLLTLVLLGWQFALLQALALVALGLFLSRAHVELTDPHAKVPQSPWHFGFTHLVDRSAPWILLSLILANLIGHPSVPLSHPVAQVLVLALLFLPLRFCNLGAAVLAMSLAYSGWSPLAVALTLIAAPVLNLSQLKLMSWSQRLGMLLLLLILLSGIAWWQPQWRELGDLPKEISYPALTLLCLLYSSSLLRQGPRKFLRGMWLAKGHSHDHGSGQRNDSGHNHGSHSHGSHSHGSSSHDSHSHAHHNGHEHQDKGSH
ncbi:metal transporter [Shewanella sp. Iso12]|uniref:metal transporter n=1 Tax=Shewanella sp. Iso12 TaxID=1826753 RepID=UPI00142F434A|nr:metal transporter [Shewanella sp. Iso12]NJI85982.1 metal transporter [Shewanella sp. Iso12]